MLKWGKKKKKKKSSISEKNWIPQMFIFFKCLNNTCSFLNLFYLPPTCVFLQFYYFLIIYVWYFDKNKRSVYVYIVIRFVRQVLSKFQMNKSSCACFKTQSHRSSNLHCKNLWYICSTDKRNLCTFANIVRVKNKIHIFVGRRDKCFDWYFKNRFKMKSKQITCNDHFAIGMFDGLKLRYLFLS